MIDELVATRAQIVEYLRRELLGPSDGDDEAVCEIPYRKYTTGVLFPRNSTMSPIMEDEEEDTEGIETDEQASDPLVLASQYFPSSIGMSFYLRHEPRIAIQIKCARYVEKPVEAEKGSMSATPENWQRVPIVFPATGTSFEPVMDEKSKKTDIEILDGLARLYIIWRPINDGWLITVTIINNKVSNGWSLPDPGECLYQVALHCHSVGKAAIVPYPHTKLATDDEEELILELLYRHKSMYGIGHGCSVMWRQPEDGTASEIWTEMLPVSEVAPMDYDLPGYDRPLSLSFLSQNHADLIQELSRFVEGYRDWIVQLSQQHVTTPLDLQKARETLLKRLDVACKRMEEGVGLLKSNDTVREAFCLANEAMLMQMMHSRAEYAGTRKCAGAQPYIEPALAEDIKWRPFQLAFQLLTISSVACPNHDDRNIVDLIWFPTGGGKTEAYLVVAAFLIWYRRLSCKAASGGTAVLMRYTLRLLTAQQFRRAATLICACEKIRSQDPDKFGSHEISIGLWVGRETTPNTYQEARAKYDELVQMDEPSSVFQLDRCPWCGTEIVPQYRQSNLRLYGIQATNSSFFLYCPNTTCDFHQKLPVGVVDAQLYDNPPTLLMATVDKFARLPWEQRVVEFFGGRTRRPPDLIIQDELHLISGPLGTIVGLYETAVDALASWNGTAPKILASTATIRRAEEQCVGLYARKVQLFPPSGLDARDSYFAQHDYKRPGRLYIGVLSASHNAPLSMVRTTSALLQAPIDLQLTGDMLDAYWTLVAYHNSLRDLGRNRAFGADDIPARIKVIARDQADLRNLEDERVQELTSNVGAAQLGDILHRLEKRAQQDGEIALLLCTNMLSVGIDVPRLNAMVVSGQPKSTSEYIQATSRVGRGNVPGLVVCVYSPFRPRDRSHYERFVSYHSALYRQVEPTSVTPFARPARDRALHAVLVALIRYKLGLPAQEDAGRFTLALSELQRSTLQRIVHIIQTRIENIDPREVEDTVKQIWELLKQWEQWAEENPRLSYSTYHAAKESLLYDASKDCTVGWPTLQSMRNVDVDCLIRIMKV